VRTGFWSGDLKERDHLENLTVDGRKILICFQEMGWASELD